MIRSRLIVKNGSAATPARDVVKLGFARQRRGQKNGAGFEFKRRWGEMEVNVVW
jgi:hypothetical protein